MATVRMREAELRAAMRDRRYWQPGHPERADYASWVSEGWQRLHGPDAAEDGGERVVEVRAYDRVRNGRTEHVDAYAQRRRGGADADARETSRRAAPEPAPAPAPQRPTLVIFVGGLFDGTSGLVRDVHNDLRSHVERSGVSVEARCASHDQGPILRAWIRDAAPSTRIVVVGHSWGADTAAQAVARLGQEGLLVDQLVTIDPVGNGVTEAYLRRVRAGTLEWINVNAADHDPMDPSNQIAQVGRPYGQRPAPFASQLIEAPFAHGAFRSMLQTINPAGSGSPFGRILGW
jgi:acetyl esterase/lipase